MKKIKSPYILFLPISLVVVFVLYLATLQHNQQDKPNIIVFKISNLKTAELIAEETQSIVPTLYKLYNSSIQFPHSYKKSSWVHIFQTLDRIKQSEINKYHYATFGPGDNLPVAAQKKQNPLDLPARYYIPINKGMLEYGFDYLIMKLSQTRKLPFFVTLDIKSAAFPIPNIAAVDRAGLNSHQKTVLEKVLNSPQNFSNRIPLLLSVMDLSYIENQFLSLDPNDSRFKARRFFLKKLATLSLEKRHLDVDLIKSWRNSKHYSDDLKLIQRIHEIQLARVDKEIARLLVEIQKNKGLKNTVILVIGEHGKSISIDGLREYSASSGDIATKFPFFIHFPKQATRVEIKQQIGHNSILKIIRLLLSKPSSLDEFVNHISKNTIDNIILSRNCNLDQITLRYKGNWRLTYHFLDERYELFDISTNQGQLVNIYAFDHPKAGLLREIMLDNFRMLDFSSFPTCRKTR